MRMIMIACFLTVLPGVAFAGSTEAAQCSASLEPNAKILFDATISSIKPGADVRAALTEKAKSMVMGGKMARADAQAAAPPAGQCLKLAAQ
jgi:hypothetical protein